MNEKNKNKQTIQVKTLTLFDLLEKANAPKFIDYLSIDTEGSEYEILKNFDFSKYTFGLIDVEHNFVEPRRSLIKNLLILNGYIYKGQNEFDDMYYHNSVKIPNIENSEFILYLAICSVLIFVFFNIKKIKT